MQFMYAVWFYGREEHNRYNIDLGSCHVIEGIVRNVVRIDDVSA